MPNLTRQADAALAFTAMGLDDARWDRLSARWNLPPSFRPSLQAALYRAAPTERFIDDLCLAVSAAAGFAEPLAVFEVTCVQPLTVALRRWAPADSLDDLLQDVRTRLLTGPTPRLTTFRGECPLGLWVRAAAVRVALNRLSANRPLSDGDEALHDLAAPVDVALDVARAEHRVAFQKAFRDAMQGLSSTERMLLRLHYLQGVRLESLAVTLRCHRATVVRKLSAAKAAVFSTTRTLLTERLALSTSELESLLREGRQQLTVSLASSQVAPVEG